MSPTRKKAVTRKATTRSKTAKKKPAAKRARAKRETVIAVEPPSAPIEVVEPMGSETPPTPPREFPVMVEPGKVDEAFKKLSAELKHWANKGRYTRVRFKFRGKQLGPDIPLAAVIAAQGVSLWARPVVALAVSVAGGSLLQVELVNDADKKILEGRDALLGGDVDKALELFKTAVEMDRDNPGAQLNIGIALKLKGDREGARAALENAKKLDPNGATGEEAERILKTLT